MEMKYWHNGGLVSEEQLHRDQSASEVYRDASNRIANIGSPADKARLHRRWPTLREASGALTASFAGLTPEEKAADLETIETDLNMIEAG